MAIGLGLRIGFANWMQKHRCYFDEETGSNFEAVAAHNPMWFWPLIQVLGQSDYDSTKHDRLRLSAFPTSLVRTKLASMIRIKSAGWALSKWRRNAHCRTHWDSNRRTGRSSILIERPNPAMFISAPRPNGFECYTAFTVPTMPAWVFFDDLGLHSSPEREKYQSWMVHYSGESSIEQIDEFNDVEYFCQALAISNYWRPLTTNPSTHVENARH